MATHNKIWRTCLSLNEEKNLTKCYFTIYRPVCPAGSEPDMSWLQNLEHFGACVCVHGCVRAIGSDGEKGMNLSEALKDLILSYNACTCI